MRRAAKTRNHFDERTTMKPKDFPVNRWKRLLSLTKLVPRVPSTRIPRQNRVHWLGCCLLLWWWGPTSLGNEPLPPEIHGGGATYRILPRPLPKHIGKHLPYSTTNQPMEAYQLQSRATAPYAYGWFGASPSPHWSRHFGYGQKYTQWTLR